MSSGISPYRLELIADLSWSCNVKKNITAHKQMLTVFFYTTQKEPNRNKRNK